MIANIISGLFARILVALCNLAVLLLSTHYLGSSIVGQVSVLILNMAVIQTINEIFTGPALIYFIAQNDLRSIYRAGILWTIICVITLNIIFYLINYFTGGKEFSPPLHLLVLSFVCSLHSFHNVILLGRQKIMVYSALVLMQPLIMLAALAVNVLVLHQASFNAVVAALYVSWMLSFIVSSIQVSLLREDPSGTTAVFKLRSALKNGLINQAGNLAHTLSNRFNFYVLTTAAAVGVYAISTSLIESVWIIGASISPVILTKIANQREAPKNTAITFLLAKISFVLSALCVVIIFLIPESFFNWLLGKDFTGAKTIMLYLSPGVLCISFSTVISHYFSGLGQQRVLLIANLSGLTVTLCTCYYFILQFGITGACYSASLSYMTQALVLTIFFMKKNRVRWLSLFSVAKELEHLKS